jgi:CHAD domain-containing protein
VARAREVELDCEAPFALAAARVVEVRAAEVFEHSAGVLDLDDVEPVHDMRVATRRLRAALEVFEPCFPHKRHRKTLRRVRALADALGVRRDLDVEIELLESLAGEVGSEDGEPLAALVEDLRARQQQANDDLAPFVAAKRLKKLRRRLAKLVKVEAMKVRRVEGLDPREPLRPNAARIVRTRLDELRGLADHALAPDAGAAQHDMRIAAKRLRYVLEIVGPCVGEEARAAHRAVKELQSVLGDLHDCDLMLPKVEGIESIAVILRTRRDRLFHGFVTLWQAEASKGTWTALEAAL